MNNDNDAQRDRKEPTPATVTIPDEGLTLPADLKPEPTVQELLDAIPRL